MNSRLRNATLAVLLSSMSAVAAAGNASDSVPQRTVRYSDLNLASPSGAATLYQRIRSAARSVCEAPFASDLQAQAAEQQCTHEAIKRAIYEVNAPLLTGYYLAKSRPVLTVAQR
jgi:UrcA family protein